MDSYILTTNLSHSESVDAIMTHELGEFESNQAAIEAARRFVGKCDGAFKFILVNSRTNKQVGNEYLVSTPHIAEGMEACLELSIKTRNEDESIDALEHFKDYLESEENEVLLESDKWAARLYCHGVAHYEFGRSEYFMRHTNCFISFIICHITPSGIFSQKEVETAYKHLHNEIPKTAKPKLTTIYCFDGHMTYRMPQETLEGFFA